MHRSAYARSDHAGQFLPPAITRARSCPLARSNQHALGLARRKPSSQPPVARKKIRSAVHWGLLLKEIVEPKTTGVPKTTEVLKFFEP